LLKKKERMLSFVKKHLTPDLARITPQQIEGNYQNLTKALSYISVLQHDLMEKRSKELFSEYLPSKPIQQREQSATA
jgi:hypothetical protein